MKDPVMNTQYYVHSADNNHVGPVSAELIARGVLAGKIASGTLVAPVGSPSWLPFETVGEVREAIAARSSLPPPSADMPVVVLPPAPIAPALGAAPTEAVAVESPKKPQGLDPRYRLLPVAVFGGFAAVGVIETILVLVLR